MSGEGGEAFRMLWDGVTPVPISGLQAFSEKSRRLFQALHCPNILHSLYVRT